MVDRREPAYALALRISSFACPKAPPQAGTVEQFDMVQALVGRGGFQDHNG